MTQSRLLNQSKIARTDEKYPCNKDVLRMCPIPIIPFGERNAASVIVCLYTGKTYQEAPRALKTSKFDAGTTA